MNNTLMIIVVIFIAIIYIYTFLNLRKSRRNKNKKPGIHKIPNQTNIKRTKNDDNYNYYVTKYNSQEDYREISPADSDKDNDNKNLN